MNLKKPTHNACCLYPLASMACMLLLACLSFEARAQSSDFEIKEWEAASTDKPILFYISGDGGFNSFSSDLCSALNKQGFHVIALNAKKYFWDKKTPGQTTADVENYLSKKIALRKNKHVSFIGYSFGADVLPFLLTRFSTGINQCITSAVLMAPSGSTDFEIHWSDMFGGNKKRDMDVVEEMNKLTNMKLVHISSTEDELNETRIKLRNYIHETLPGGHHFDGNIEELTRTILKYVN